MSTGETLRAFVADNFLFGQIPGNFSDDSSFLESGIIDSTGVLELVGFLEQRFEIRIHDEEIVPDNLDSINKLIGFVERKLAAPEVGALACS